MADDVFFLDDIENQIIKNIERNKQILHESFIFHAFSYEIYEDGLCVDSGVCQITINAHASDYDMSFYVQHNNEISIDKHFSIDFRSDDLLMDRIVYGRLPDNISNNMYVGSNTLPIVCEIFPQKNVLRFALLSPLRLIEFTGVIKELDVDKNHVY